MNEQLETIVKFWFHFKIAIAAFAMAFLMAIFRTYKTNGRVDFIESIMCGMFAIGIWTFMDWLEVSQIVSVGLASAVGYFGTHAVSEFIKRKLNT